MEVDHVDVDRVIGDPLFQDMGAFVDQGEQAAADNLLIADRAPLKADLRRIILDQPGDFRIRLRSAAIRIDVDALSTLLPEPAQFADAVDHRSEENPTELQS